MMMKKNIMIAPTFKMLLHEFSIMPPNVFFGVDDILMFGLCSGEARLRYKSPLIKALNMCDSKMIYPATALLSMPIPTAPTMNIGPEFEQKLDSLKASV